ncbi:MAG: hypothetical protein KDB90_04940 [Planctomycetes bacterium]|nr:hypothetical protein [Planctomycetota bacterium]
MTNNEDRIWEVLIEDAVRESATPEQPHEPGDYTRRLLTPVGPMGVDRGRSMRYTRPRWVSYVASALALALVCAILYAGAVLLPQLSDANHANEDQPQAAGSNDAPPDLGNKAPVPAPKPKPEPQPEPTDNSRPGVAPDDGGETKSEPRPGDTVEQSKPEPKPDDAVEQPEPEPKPDNSVEQPKPEPKPEPNPDGTVEQPRPDDTIEQPKQPEPTAPEPDSALSINLLTKIDWQKPGLKMFDYSPDGEIWAHAQETTHFAGNVWLRTRTGVDFEAAGVLLRLNGTMRVSLTEQELSVELTDDELFVDSRGAGRDVSLSTGEFSLSLLSCAAYVEHRPSSDELRVYEGDVRIGDQLISGPQRGKLENRRKPLFSVLRSKMADEPFLRDLLSRVIYRQDFDADPNGRLREGTLKDGVISGPNVFWGYPVNIQYEVGMVIRLRVRFTGATAATLTQFAIPRSDNFSFELDAERLRPGEWQVIEVPVDKFLERTNHKEHPNEVDWFQNVSIAPKGENAQVELDWVELIRAVK